MAVSDRDVLHVAALARIAVDPARLPALVRELNGILDHMDDLQRVDASGAGAGTAQAPTPLRSDTAGASVPLAVPREEFAPEMRDGFFLVPRLATHDGEAESSA